ncbi:tagatose-bisphosphate aldolase 2 domain protein, partial [Yersinia pestis PY-63]
MKQRLKWLF